jgi:hypothetical protein
MKEEMVLKHEFVEFIPDELEQGTIYGDLCFDTFRNSIASVLLRLREQGSNADPAHGLETHF